MSLTEDEISHTLLNIVLSTALLVGAVAGITPLLFEKSFQAQFLKPMAVSIAFGLSFATILTLLVVPSLYLIGNDVRRAMRWLRTGQWVAPEDVVKRDETIVQPDSTNTIQNGGV